MLVDLGVLFDVDVVLLFVEDVFGGVGVGVKHVVGSGHFQPMHFDDVVLILEVDFDVDEDGGGVVVEDAEVEEEDGDGVGVEDEELEEEDKGGGAQGSVDSRFFAT